MNPLKLTNRQYDILKFVAQIGLPGLGTLYFALASLWGLPKVEEVVGTITAIDVFLGLFLGTSTKGYLSKDENYDGAFVVGQDEDGTPTGDLQLHTIAAPTDALGQREIRLKVKRK